MGGTFASPSDDACLRCSFCGKRRHEVRALVTGPDVCICGRCLELCADILQSEKSKCLARSRWGVPTPAAIAAGLEDYVVGQARAKHVLAVAVHNHYKRLAHAGAGAPGVELAKSNVLLLGPTGSGKTLLAQTLARLIEVPFAQAEATTLTEAGYVGEDVESVVQKLLQAADGDVGKAEHGIVFIDEIDKISRRTGTSTASRDVSGEGVQQGLLRILEGTTVSLPARPAGRRALQGEPARVETGDILFICGGAFAGLERIVARRRRAPAVGFGAEVRRPEEPGAAELLREVEPEDLLAFGMIPEFVGRLPVVATLDELDEAALVEVLGRPRNALLKQYCRLFEMDGVRLTFQDEALRAVARKAIRRGAGARGLRSIMEELLLEPMFLLPSLEDVVEVAVTREAVEAGARPLFVFGDRRREPGAGARAALPR